MTGNDFISCRDAVFVLEAPPREPRQATPRMVRERRGTVRRGWRHMLAWLRRPHAPVGSGAGVTGRR
jgi:hypothetical protein